MAWFPLQEQLAGVCVPLQMTSSVAAPALRGEDGVMVAREGFTRTSPNGDLQVLFSGERQGSCVERRGNKVQGEDRTYPACLTESPLKERMEGHGVFPTTGQTAVCKKACTQLVTPQDQ